MTQKREVTILVGGVYNGNLYKYVPTTIEIEWCCPVCGSPYGEIWNRGGEINGWESGCAHLPSYNDVFVELHDEETLFELLGKPIG